MGIAGFGVWARGLEGPDAFFAAHKAGYANLLDAEFLNPKPEAIPPKERRRAGLMINLAVEVAHQACEQASVDKTEIPSVFASAMGDTAITDYMCRKLAKPEKLLSPTKFHNSVHNAPSGYWTISSRNRAPSSFVGGFRESFGAGLLEAASQANALAAPVLLVAYDIANAAPFHDIEPVTESLGVALVITPGAVTPEKGETTDLLQGTLSYEAVESEAMAERLALPTNPCLRGLADANPIGSSLSLLEQLASIADSEHVKENRLCFAAAPAALVELQT